MPKAHISGVPRPQHHRGMAPLFCFTSTNLKSFSHKIITITIINDKLLSSTPFHFLWQSMWKQSVSVFPNYFGMSITVWSRCSYSGSNTFRHTDEILSLRSFLVSALLKKSWWIYRHSPFPSYFIAVSGNG